MSGFYLNENIWQAGFITLILGGGCAWLTGCAIAETWRGIFIAALAALAMSFALRFVHFALYGEPLLSGKAWLLELVLLLPISCLSFQRARARQMVRQYYWLYEPRGWFGWHMRQDAPSPGPNR